MVPLAFETSLRSSYAEPLSSAPGAENSPPEAFASFESHLQDTDRASTPPAEPSPTPDDSPAAHAERQETDDSAEAAPADRSQAEGTAEERASHEAPVPPLLAAANQVELNLDPASVPAEEETVGLAPDAVTNKTSAAESARPAVRGRIAAPSRPSRDAPQNTEIPREMVAQQPAATEAPTLTPADSSAAKLPDTPSASVAQPESSAAHPPQPAVADSTARLAAASSAVVVADAIEEKAPAERAAPSGSLSDIELKMALPPLSPADLKAPASEVVRDRDRNDGRTREAEVSQDGAESLEPAEPPAQGPPARFGQHLLARVEERSDSGRHLSEADQTRFVERVARAVRLAEGREGVLRLRLSPPELGSLRLEVRVHHGVLAARLETETSAARSLLVDNLQVLRERLAEQGVRVEQFDVDLRDGRQRESLDAGPQWRQRDPSERRPAEHPLPDEAHAGPGASGPAPLNGMRQLDVKV